MKCKACGLEVAEGANFCGHCGAPVTVQGQVAAAQAGPAGAGAGAGAAAGLAPGVVMSPPPDQTPEKTLWDETPSMRTALPGILSWVLGGLVLIIAVKFIPTGFTPIIEWSIIGVVAAIVLFMLGRYYVRLHSIRYRLTTQRIFVTYGLLNKRTDEIELEKYKDIFVNQDFWDKMVGCGDIEVVTGDVTNPTIKIIDVEDPIAKKETIRAAARERKSMLGITRREEL